MSKLSSWFNKTFNPPPPPAPIINMPAMPAYNPPPAPVMPSLPPIILSAPQPQQQALMPSIGAGAPAAKLATQALQNKNGRSSTILTTRKKRRQQGNEGGFDTYAGTSLGS